MDRIQIWLLFVLALSTIVGFTALIENQSAIIGMVGVVVGIVLGSFISYSIEISRNRKRFRYDHLFDIKQKCLEPIKRNLSETLGRFRFYDQIPTSQSIQTDLSSSSHWWDRENADYWISRDIDNGLYKDLISHKITKDIPNKIDVIRGKFESSYRNFLTVYIDLYNKLSAKVSADSTIVQTKKENYLIALVHVAMGERADFRWWPNVFNTVQKDGLLKKLDKDQQIVLRYKESKKFINAKNEISKLFKTSIDAINTILDSYELDEDCKYIKAKV